MELGMTIDFYCPGCGNLVRAPDATAGRKGRCANCNLKVQIPPQTLAGTGGCEPPVSADPPTPPKIQFFCFRCGGQVRVAHDAAGQRGQCPHCEAVVQIPDGSAD